MAPRKPASAPATAPPRRSARLNTAAGGPNQHTRARVSKTPQVTPKPKRPRYDCTTCGRNLASSSFPNHLVTDDCQHRINTCRDCTRQWIATSLQTRTYDKLSCPECPALMRNADVKRHATLAVYERFTELERRGIADKTPGWRWCLNPTCKAGQVHEPAAADPVEPISTAAESNKSHDPPPDICICTTCGASACACCDRPSHEGETCAAHQTRQQTEAEQATLATIQRDCKPCPKCGKNIEKNGGCDYIHCTQCDEPFCWRCLTPYSVIVQSGHGKECVYTQPGNYDPHAGPQAQAPPALLGAQDLMALFGVRDPRAAPPGQRAG